MKVFLGGTVNGSRWRDFLITKLEVDYFDPVVKVWTEEARQNEIYERNTCEYLLYVLTPKMDGYYSIAEVTDDSYKRPDRTIFCYLEEDDGHVFSKDRQNDLKRLSRKVIENGAIYLSTLNDVADFLNSANQRTKSIRKQSDFMYDAFISYGRRHSSVFAEKLNNKLLSEGKKVWFDKNNIPLAVDFQEQIDEGIERSDNFIFIISPHSVKSEYCRKEIELALKYGKRIIPILHVEPIDSWNLMVKEIAQLNWIYFREEENFSIPLNQWMQIDNFDLAFDGLVEVLNSHKEYVRFHTLLLHSALKWVSKQRATPFLLTGKDKTDAEKWLVSTVFKDSNTGITNKAPSTPSDLHAEYIVESKKNANNLQTEIFVSFFEEEDKRKNKIINGLSRFGITSWVHTRDIAKGGDFEKETNLGIIRSDNFLYLIRKNEIDNKFLRNELRLAKRYNKRIIPVLLEEITKEERESLPWFIKKLSFIDFTKAFSKHKATDITIQNLKEQQNLIKNSEDFNQKSIFERRLDELIAIVKKDAEFYSKHKYLLNQAIRWKDQNLNASILLRGYNLENAIKWLKEAEIKDHKPVEEQVEFIKESQSKIGLLNTDVFISYSRKDADFARRINEYLQLSGKNTWFDQESIASASDFQQEIYSGIENADNFLLIISPDAVKSPYCEDEVNFAVKNNKRIISVLFVSTEVKDLPSALKKIQWIDFTIRSFTDSFAELLRTLDLDREYVRFHTKYAQLSSDWMEKQRPNELLLRGSELIFAHDWLKAAIKKSSRMVEARYLHPHPTQVQTDYIETSYKEAEKRKKLEEEHQQKLLFLEQERSRVADEKLAEQRKASKRQKVLILIISFVLLLTMVAVFEAIRQSTFAKEKAREARELLKEVENQKNLLNLSKLKLELALASIDSLQRVQDEALANANSVEEAQNIVKKYKSEINEKKQASESVLLQSDEELLNLGKSDVMAFISEKKKEVKSFDIKDLQDSVALLSKQLNGFMDAKQRTQKLSSLIAYYDALAVKAKKSKYRLMESNSYDNLIINRKEIFDKISLTKEVIKIRENLFSKNPSNSLIYSKLSVNYGNLAWYYLLVGKFNEALLAARRGYEIDHSQFWIRIYYADALLLLGETEEAIDIFYKYRNAQHFRGHSFKQEYVKEIATLKKFGIESPDFQKVLDIVRKNE